MSENITNNNTGAISALKGYRVQFLYSLLRVLSYNEHESKFIPEGKYEDLDIYNENDQVIELIQVKDLTNTLTLSKILSLKQNTFIQRGLNAFREGKCPKIKLVSFGEVNDDIKSLGKKKYTKVFIKKLEKLKLNIRDVKILQEFFEYEIVNETEVVEEIISKIEQWNIFVNSKITLDILIYWIYYAAEKQLVITPINFKEQFERIILFQRERISFEKTYNVLIRSLDGDLNNENIESLRSDFYQGISATYKHILVNADVQRIEKLNAINKGFKETNIVFIHGASGQGKSSLAYRYLHEAINRSTVFELKRLTENTETIFEVINSLEGISKGITFPITIYIDVNPGDKEWINILLELSSKKNFNFLITIREEDWNKMEVGDKFQFSEIELLFEKVEAELIYKGLNLHIKDIKFIDFENAWRAFGGKGPLLEFVYLITQNESLKSKLRSQINKIKLEDSIINKEKIKLLRYIVLADCYDSKIKYKDFARILKHSDITLLVDLLQKEFLIKITRDKSNSYLSGLHPIRSKIIKGFLFDNEVFEESNYILDSIFFISDNSILNFLRNAFMYANLSPNKLLERLKTFSPLTWQAHFLIFKSLLWKGIHDYITDNLSILNKIYENYNTAWITVVDFDFAGVMEGGSIMESSNLFKEEQRQYAKSVNKQFSPKEEVFKYCFNWLNDLKYIDAIPYNQIEWNAFGTLLFWLNYSEQAQFTLDYNRIDFDNSLNEQTLEVISKVLLGLKTCNKNSQSIVKKIQFFFLKKLSEKYSIISIEEKNESINCYYLFDFLDENVDRDESNFINAKSVKIIELLRLAFPFKNSYGTKGIGHQLSFLSANHDDSLKQIERRSLPVDELVEINSIFMNLYNYEKRLSTWTEYVDLVIKKRILFLEIMKKMARAFKLYHKQKELQPIIVYIKNYSNNFREKLKELSAVQFPKIIIDEWGNVSEGSSKIGKSKISSPDMSKEEQYKEDTQVLAVRKYSEFKNKYSDFNSSMENFLWQSTESITYKIMSLLKKDVSDLSDYSRISLVGNLFRVYECLSGFQHSFKKHFSKLVDPIILQNLEREERQYISLNCYLYRQFIYSNSYLKGNVFKLAISRLNHIETIFKNTIVNTFKQLEKSYGYLIRVDFDENNKRGIIIIDFYQPIESFDFLKIIYEHLFDVIGQPEYTSLKYLIISSKFPEFYYIPLIQGKTLNGKWYEFNMYNLIERQFDELETFNLIPKDIPKDVEQYYYLKSWNKNLSKFNDLDKLLECISTAYLFAFSFSQLKFFENKKSEDYNDVILKRYVEKIGKTFQENIQRGLDLFTKYIELCNNKKIEFNDINEKLEFYELLTALLQR